MNDYDYFIEKSLIIYYKNDFIIISLNCKGYYNNFELNLENENYEDECQKIINSLQNKYKSKLIYNKKFINGFLENKYEKIINNYIKNKFNWNDINKIFIIKDLIIANKI